MATFYVTLSNSGGELAREPVSESSDITDTDAFKEAVERLVASIGFFAPGDTIKIIEVE